MTTEAMQKALADKGYRLKRQHYARTNSRGWLTDGYRWECHHATTGQHIATGQTPAIAFKRANEVLERGAQ